MTKHDALSVNITMALGQLLHWIHDVQLPSADTNKKKQCSTRKETSVIYYAQPLCSRFQHFLFHG